MLIERYRQVRSEIDAACARAGRKPEDVTLIAVSKTKPLAMMEELIAHGVTEFGENRPQELRDKYEALPDGVHLHMIGHLQRNKVKYVVPRACMIHSVDSLPLARAIQEEAQKRALCVPILVEVNVAGEDTKFGTRPKEALPLITDIAAFPNVRVCGLMTIAPFVENPEDNRIHFRNLYQLFVDIKARNIDNVTMRHLSMGMTNDYAVAVEEGATLVRVGTGIFGAREDGFHSLAGT